jgi:hypothetical protein
MWPDCLDLQAVFGRLKFTFHISTITTVCHRVVMVYFTGAESSSSLRLFWCQWYVSAFRSFVQMLFMPGDFLDFKNLIVLISFDRT